ncbi:MAG: Glutamate 5-kinase [Lentisphaerae bacterium ADurb.Bin242]|nr:MAG: Glutamate 5-kinase [Lentisphaerae bacterium ADurb.Bin242]
MNAENCELRKKLVKNCHRIVVKAGTRLLTDPRLLPVIIAQIKRIRDAGKQVILVSSGAVGTGMKSMGLKRRPRRLSEVQALAALGQVKLMSMYEAECEKLGFRAAQILLTAEDLRSRERHLNVLNCIETLLAKNVLPIINENDPVSVDELKFGDNDILASLLASMTRADLAIILTTVDGLKRPNPDGTLGGRISIVRGITQAERSMASGTDDGNLSIGGMASKLKAADTLNSAGEALWLASGKEPDILERIFNGEDVGTLFLPPVAKKKMESRKRWLSAFCRPKGKLVVDDGAVLALKKKGSSLLGSGIFAVNGEFERGDMLEIVSGSNVLIAKGLTNFSSDECRLLMGHKSSENHAILHYDADEEIIHRNNMYVVK